MKTLLLILSLIIAPMDMRIPTYFTLDLHTFDAEGTLCGAEGLSKQLEEAKALGAEGVVADMWWGTVEKAPKTYDFDGYLKLAEIVENAGLELQFIIGFHGCAEEDQNCSKRLPTWVLESSDEIFPKGANGRVSKEYISIFADEKKVLKDRTPLEAYNDFLEKFSQRFWRFLGVTIKEVHIGLGPSGQLRYPSYRVNSYCGVGEFMAYDKFAKEVFGEYLNKIGKTSFITQEVRNEPTASAWLTNFFKTLTVRKDQCAIMGPLKIDCGFMGITKTECESKGCCYSEVGHEAWCYQKGKLNQSELKGDIEETADGEFGKIFTQFYSRSLIAHGDRVLAKAREALGFLRIGAKLSAVHWTAGSVNRAPEMTAGYLVSDDFNFYKELMPVLKKHLVILVLSGFEMINNMTPEVCYSRAQDLLKSVKSIALDSSVEIMGENAHERTDDYALNTIASQAEGIKSFNFLRLNTVLKQSEYVHNQVKNLCERLENTDDSLFDYDVGLSRKNHHLEVECEECKNDASHMLLH